MLILTIRSDKPEAEIGLFNNTQQLGYTTWQAHRELAETIHQKIADLLQEHIKTLQELDGILVYQGPGSFTGLRIGITVANALKSALGVTIMAEAGDDWINKGLVRLRSGESLTIAMPEYGSQPHTTPQKH